MIFTLPDIDQETLDELLESIEEMIDEIEPALNLLATQPDNVTALNELFRNLHTIKGNFRMCFIDPFTDYVHSIEELISEVRKQRLQFDVSIKDVCMMAIDRMRAQIEVLTAWAELDTRELEYLGQIIEQMANTEQTALAGLCSEFRQALTSSDRQENYQANDKSASTDTPEPSITILKADSLATPQATMAADLASFGILARKLEERVPHWQGHFEMMLLLANAALPMMPWKIDRTQMNAAVYLHDIGMSTIPRAITDKAGPLTTEERQRLYKHPKLAWQYLCKQSEWSEAAEIVLHHHERPDGLGYPQGLKDADIHPGAKLLAIVDAFSAMTHDRPDRVSKRSVLDALKEISQFSGTQFDPTVVKILITVAKPLFASQ
jgi:HD-GYP domain-containing protein (c-di-GMP phosphodiesterase class II)